MNGHDTNFIPAPKLLAVIVDRSESFRLEDILRERHVHFHYMFHAQGTASSERLKAFGLSGTEKMVCVCIESAHKVKHLLLSVMERLELVHPGHGIVFVIPISGISATISNAFHKELEERHERWTENVEHDAEKTNCEAHFELVVAIVNQGFSQDVMDAARVSGARGGTIINARRTGIEDAVKFFGISLQAEKEIVAILIPKVLKKELMQAVSKSCGMKTEARGIVISLPVESCSGIDMEDEND